MLNSRLIASTSPEPNRKQIYEDQGLRITVLTPRMIRVETGKTFTDSATQSVWFRDLGIHPFKIEPISKGFKLITEEAEFIYNAFKKAIEFVSFDKGKTVVPCNNKGNLKGTARTLDNTFGPIPLKDGVLSRTGVAVIKDYSLLLCKDGFLNKREADTTDTYIFAYGNDYRRALRDFFLITGKVPLIPRSALGNWWSRYHAYSQQEYMDLIRRFKEERLPLSVATIDMDWHWVDIKKQFPDYKGKDKWWRRLIWNEGWTGYSWNKELFPDYKGFIKWLEDEGLKTIINLHPASGIRCFEDMYEKMCAEMGVDPATKQTIPFDIADPNFINAYFKVLHRPYEKDGVDFWWVDWQQGRHSGLRFLDPLWGLNHYHTLHSSGDNKRPMILSRFAGVGSHRYPLGFSGDTIVCWRALKFQPYFTVTAANIGYTWWSHDIGGHFWGTKDDELYLRWLQFGVFSPINRLHSTRNALMGKEIWNFKPDVKKYARRLLEMRHKLVPYIYTMNYHTHNEGKPLCEPIYYQYPDVEEAYEFKNQYFFGSELLVCPITSKMNKRMELASVKAYLPEGEYTDIFTGRVYKGDKTYTLCRELNEIPVFAKKGAIIPMTCYGEIMGTNIPDTLDVWFFRGTNSFKLYEDNGEDMGYEKGKRAFTEFSIFTFEEANKIKIKIKPSEGDISVLPAKRNYNIVLKDVTDTDKIAVIVNGKTVKHVVDTEFGYAIKIFDILPTDSVEVSISGYEAYENPTLKSEVIRLFSRLNGNNIAKTAQFNKIRRVIENKKLLRRRLKWLRVPKVLKLAIKEVIDTIE